MDMSEPAFIEPPFTADYVRLACCALDMHACWSLRGQPQMQGYNITMGAGCYMNFNCCILDCAPVKIGKNVSAIILTIKRHCMLY